ncbi:hypothetical protein [Mycolicibacterium gadium]|uniref:Uncharacterized protein n=1 Tax=Mycolicibacterium gadium TaxID=1794 RepID=A0ABT6GJK7_MYCGU|nr:hypothetical protein [Mycolicibacterium gadium]MDG5481539.1 hypothetical protein [Mycolicibacterium gadium]
MTLTDPREALADQSHFIGYLVGLASLGRTVRQLATEGDRTSGPHRDPDDFVYALLGLASVGTAIERLTYPTEAQSIPTAETPSPAATTRWLR